MTPTPAEGLPSEAPAGAAGRGEGGRIHDQGYRPFDGPLLSVRTRFVAIAANELRQAWKSRWVRRLVWAAFFPLGVFSVLVFVSARMESILGPVRVWPHFWRVQLFFGMLAIFFVGRRAVGEDLRSGAMALYFSRAVDFRQYLLGKWLAVAAAVGLVVLAPGLLLSLFRLAIDPAASVLDGLAWIGSLAVLAAALALAGGFTMLALSSLAGRGRAAGIAWVLVFFVSNAAGLALASATGLDALTAVGIGSGSQMLAEGLFGHEPAGLAVWAMLAGQLGWGALAAAVVTLRLRRWRAM